MGLWLGRAQRSGGLTERFINSFPVGLDAYDMLGNPQLGTETNHQIDLTFELQNRSTRIDLNIFASLLNSSISSVIDTNLSPTMPMSPGVRRYINLDEAFMSGFEITWKQRLFSGLEHHFSVAYTYGQDRSRKEPLPEIAPLDLRYILIGKYINNKLRPTLTFRYIHNQDRISEAYGETETPSFSLLDVAVSYKFHTKISATIGIQNLFNQLYYEHLNRYIKGQNRPIYAPGRNFYLSFALNLM